MRQHAFQRREGDVQNILRSRFIVDDRTDPHENLALEEAIFMKINDDGLACRVWANDESVIIGRAQVAHLETDVEECAREGIPIVRRFTAGGAVYNGPGNINWSLFVGRGFQAGHLRYRFDATKVFDASAQVVLASLRRLQVKAWLDPPNRIVTEAGKVCGMAAYISKTGSLCHGTLLLDADLEKVRRLTTPASQQVERRYTRSRDVRTANTHLDADSFIRTFLSVMAEETGLPVDQERADGAELDTMVALLPRYKDVTWNFGDPFQKDQRSI